MYTLVGEWSNRNESINDILMLRKKTEFHFIIFNNKNQAAVAVYV